MNMEKVSVFSDVVCELGEGPSYDPASETLFWFDITGKKLLQKKFPDGRTVVHDLPFMGSAIATVDAERQLLVAEDGIYVRYARTGSLALHTPLEADNASTRSNDARVHPSGSFWIGTMAKDEAPKAGAIYWFSRGEIRRLYDGITVPNSICFAADGATAYLTGKSANVIHRVECDPATGLPTGELKVFADTKGAGGWVDGSVVDAEGVLWNARWGGARIDAYAPDGTLLRSIRTPAGQSSCPAFVGPDASRIAVTSAWKGLDVAARAADPEAGKTFLLDIPVRGRFEPKVLL
ncbi:SMP-30/gluconolactonase/LRE family protein [Neomesorhizobium albiziae]|nr:SMP-30/gluconolactonase/LRE family protein [Mesorhizobium albiziae]